MKRFYKDVAIEATDGGFTVALDGRSVRTPGRAMLIVPNRKFADAVAAEWADQGEDIRPTTMPMTRLANTAIDIVGLRRSEVVGNLASYADTDLLCYRAAEPQDLVSRQAAGWQPLLDWACEYYGARLEMTTGVGHVPQHQATLDAVLGAVDAHDDWQIAGLNDLVTISSSVVLGLAVSAGEVDWQRAWELSRLDEKYQNERWGEDAEEQAREKTRKREMAEAGRYLNLLRAS
jgi:chaperone required for assembly of F1-ATPase